jgi:hypothetical protein
MRHGGDMAIDPYEEENYGTEYDDYSDTEEGVQGQEGLHHTSHST